MVDAADWNGVARSADRRRRIKLDRIAGPVGQDGRWRNHSRDDGQLGALHLGRWADSRRRAFAAKPWLETAGGDITANEVGGRAEGVDGRRARSRDAGRVDCVGEHGGRRNRSGLGARDGDRGKLQWPDSGGSGGRGPVRDRRRRHSALERLRAPARYDGGRRRNRAASGGGTPEDSFLVTGLGDITVFVPSNLGIRILAQIESADAKRIVSRFSGSEGEGMARWR